MKLLVINGPNLNFLGIREKEVYGMENYEYLLRQIHKKAEEMGILVEVYQSNHEGAIIDKIQEAYFDKIHGIIINPVAYTHYSYAIRDALACMKIPKIEVHISNIMEREDFRKISVIREVCDEQIKGEGLKGYERAMELAVKLIENNKK